MTFSESFEWGPDGKPQEVGRCAHTIKQHMRMEEAKASAELEGAKTNKTICQLIDESIPSSEPKDAPTSVTEDKPCAAHCDNGCVLSHVHCRKKGHRPPSEPKEG